jgi:hypothetical protein
MAKVVDESHYGRAFEAAMTLAIALKMGVTQCDDMVVVESSKYLLKEELKDWNDDPFEATRRAIARMANKILDDMADEVNNANA